MMLRKRARTIDACLRMLDLLALAGSFPVAYLVRDRLLGEKIAGRPGLYPIERYWPLLVLTLVAWVVASSLLHLYKSYRLQTLAVEARHLVQILLIVAGTAAAIGYLAKNGDISRQFVFLYFVIGMGLLMANRLLLRYALHALRRHGYSTRIVAVVGTCDLACRIAEKAAARQDWGYHFAGYIEAREEPGPRCVGPVLGDLSKLDSMLASDVLDEVIFVVRRERMEDVEAAVRTCKAHGVTARICFDLAMQHPMLELEELGGIPLLSIY